MAEVIGITRAVVNRHVRDGQVSASADADGLDRSVLDVKVGDGRFSQAVRVEELGLRLSTVASLAIPVRRTTTVEVRTAGALDGDLVSLDLKERTGPFLVAPGGLAFKDDLALD